jgi:hypothetical protein
MKTLIIVNSEIFGDYMDNLCCSNQNHIYLGNRLTNANSDIWTEEYITHNMRKEDIHTFNTSYCIYPTETIQHLLLSKNKVKIDLGINIINSLYKTKI